MGLLRKTDEDGNEIDPPILPSIILFLLVVIGALLECFGWPHW